MAIEVPEYEYTKWMSEVTKYTKYIVERTELIKDIDDDKYDFSHKSFKEYFLAVYYSKCLTPNNLVNFVIDSIGDANNHELATLIIQYLGKECLVDPFNCIIDYMLKQIEKAEDQYRMFDDNIICSYLNILIGLFSDNALPIKFSDRFISTFLSVKPPA